MTKMGRPRISCPKGHTFSVKIDKVMLNQLEEYCKKHNMNKGEVVRQGLNIVFELDE